MAEIEGTVTLDSVAAEVPVLALSAEKIEGEYQILDSTVSAADGAYGLDPGGAAFIVALGGNGGSQGPASAVLWTPAEITTALWLDAADASTITEVSGAVSDWADKSNLALGSFSQNTGSRQPSLLPAELNGLNVLSFDGSDSLPASSKDIARNTSRLQAFFVCKPASVTSDHRLINASTGTDDLAARILIGFGRTSGKFNAGGRRADSGGYSERATSASVSTSDYAIYCADINYGAATLEQWINAVSDGSSAFADAGATSDTASQRVGVGANTLGASSFFSGQISEIVFVHDGSSRQLIEGYLAWKWGLEANLPSGHPYKNAAPTV